MEPTSAPRSRTFAWLLRARREARRAAPLSGFGRYSANVAQAPPASSYSIATTGLGSDSSHKNLELQRALLRSHDVALARALQIAPSPLADSNRRPPPYHEREEGVDSCGSLPSNEVPTPRALARVASLFTPVRPGCDLGRRRTGDGLDGQCDRNRARRTSAPRASRARRAPPATPTA